MCDPSLFFRLPGTQFPVSMIHSDHGRGICDKFQTSDRNLTVSRLVFFPNNAPDRDISVQYMKNAKVVKNKIIVYIEFIESGITFIRYAHNQKVGKPINASLCEQVNQKVQTSCDKKYIHSSFNIKNRPYHITG